MALQSDTWSQLQALKRKQENLREHLQKRRKERQVLIESGTSGVLSSLDVGMKEDLKAVDISSVDHGMLVREEREPLVPSHKSTDKVDGSAIDVRLEKMIVALFHDKQVTFPVSAGELVEHLTKKVARLAVIRQASVIAILEKLEAQDLVLLKRNEQTVHVVDCEFSKLEAVYEHGKGNVSECALRGENEPPKNKLDKDVVVLSSKKPGIDPEGDDLASLLSMPTMKEIENKKLGEEILELLNQPTAKEKSLVEKFRSQGGAMVREFCQFGTREECRISNMEKSRCRKLHFQKIIQSHTDESLGDCSFLNTCFHMDTCKYVHYEVDMRGFNEDQRQQEIKVTKISELAGPKVTLTPPQWINCDVRYIDFDVLGKFAVVMADPPWDIHMELPYGTMADHEMKNLGVQKLQDNGYIFLWVTGRAIELGRECLQIWGYKRIDELIWVKTNQLQRLIRTGRTGHWINHGKEHCLIGVKGNPSSPMFNRGLDCDVLVSEVRDTSHKPDEIYGLIERLAPGQRKIELFGRQHNVQPNWITLGNQLNGVNLCDPDVVKLFSEKYPDGICAKPQPKSVPTIIELTPSQGSDQDYSPM